MEALRRVFADVLRCAGVDQVELQIVRLWDAGAGGVGGAGEVPAVDVVVAEVLDRGERSCEGGEVGCIGRKGGAFGEEKGRLGMYVALQDDAAAGLVWERVSKNYGDVVSWWRSRPCVKSFSNWN